MTTDAYRRDLRQPGELFLLALTAGLATVLPTAHSEPPAPLPIMKTHVIEYDHDRGLVVSADDRHIVLWHLQSEREIARLLYRGQVRRPFAAAIGPKRRFVVTTTFVWDVQRGVRAPLDRCGTRDSSVRWAGRRVIISRELPTTRWGNSTLCVVDPRRNEVLFRDSGLMAWNRTRTRALFRRSSSRELVDLDALSGRFQTRTSPEHFRPVEISGDGRWVADANSVAVTLYDRKNFRVAATYPRGNYLAERFAGRRCGGPPPPPRIPELSGFVGLAGGRAWVWIDGSLIGTHPDGATLVAETHPPDGSLTGHSGVTRDGRFVWVHWYHADDLGRPVDLINPNTGLPEVRLRTPFTEELARWVQTLPGPRFAVETGGHVYMFGSDTHLAQRWLTNESSWVEGGTSRSFVVARLGDSSYARIFGPSLAQHAASRIETVTSIGHRHLLVHYTGGMAVVDLEQNDVLHRVTVSSAPGTVLRVTPDQRYVLGKTTLGGDWVWSLPALDSVGGVENSRLQETPWYLGERGFGLEPPPERLVEFWGRRVDGRIAPTGLTKPRFPNNALGVELTGPRFDPLWTDLERSELTVTRDDRWGVSRLGDTVALANLSNCCAVTKPASTSRSPPSACIKAQPVCDRASDDRWVGAVDLEPVLRHELGRPVRPSARAAGALMDSSDLRVLDVAPDARPSGLLVLSTVGLHRVELARTGRPILRRTWFVTNDTDDLLFVSPGGKAALIARSGRPATRVDFEADRVEDLPASMVGRRMTLTDSVVAHHQGNLLLVWRPGGHVVQALFGEPHRNEWVVFTNAGDELDRSGSSLLPQLLAGANDGSIDR